MKCPHCLEGFHANWGGLGNMEDPDGTWIFEHTQCPECERRIVKLRHHFEGRLTESLVRPRAPARAPLSRDVPEEFATDYGEACLVLTDSPKASAALSRRCLQNLLREHFNIRDRDLSAEIDQVLPKLPSHISEAVDAIRNLGNFAAHPLKSTSSAEIMDVEPGEAEWCLDVLEALFDFCFVQPAILKAKKDALNSKLKEAGKPPAK